MAGVCIIYIDGIMGCCPKARLSATLATVGPDAIEVRKTESGRRLDFLGWEFDSDLHSVVIAHHNYLKQDPLWIPSL